MICIEDPVRQEAKEVVAGLKNLGIRHVIMLTGDGEAVARTVKERLGITIPGAGAAGRQGFCY